MMTEQVSPRSPVSIHKLNGTLHLVESRAKDPCRDLCSLVGWVSLAGAVHVVSGT
jgi:hypothetical protein